MNSTKLQEIPPRNKVRIDVGESPQHFIIVEWKVWHLMH